MKVAKQSHHLKVTIRNGLRPRLVVMRGFTVQIKQVAYMSLSLSIATLEQ